MKKKETNNQISYICRKKRRSEVKENDTCRIAQKCSTRVYSSEGEGKEREKKVLEFGDGDEEREVKCVYSRRCRRKRERERWLK